MTGKSNKKTDFRPLTEGFSKKGGLNTKPISERPPAPGAHRPKPATDGNKENGQTQ